MISNKAWNTNMATEAQRHREDEVGKGKKSFGNEEERNEDDTAQRHEEDEARECLDKKERE